MSYILTESGLVADVEELRIQALEKKLLQIAMYISLIGIAVIVCILKSTGMF